jgi:hypothetical protein
VATASSSGCSRLPSTLLLLPSSVCLSLPNNDTDSVEPNWADGSASPLKATSKLTCRR